MPSEPIWAGTVKRFLSVVAFALLMAVSAEEPVWPASKPNIVQSQPPKSKAAAPSVATRRSFRNVAPFPTVCPFAPQPPSTSRPANPPVMLARRASTSEGAVPVATSRRRSGRRQAPGGGNVAVRRNFCRAQQHNADDGDHQAHDRRSDMATAACREPSPYTMIPRITLEKSVTASLDAIAGASTPVLSAPCCRTNPMTAETTRT